MDQDKATPAASVAPDRTPGVIGAIVLGGDYQGLGIVRSLGLRHIPVCVVDDEHSIARYSCYATESIVVASLRDQRQIADTLLQLAQRRPDLRGWVVYPTRDEMVAALSHNRESLSQAFRVPTPAWSTTKWVWDKRDTYHLAQELGIPTPRTWYPRTIEELDRIDGTPPFALKPAIKENFIYATKAKAWRANSRAQLRDLFRKASEQIDCEEIMIQDLIPGDGRQQFAYCAFAKGGRSVGSMVTQRARQHPPEFGRASTFVQTVDIPLLEELSERFLRATEYYGLVEIEYKLDPRDGKYRLLDVNGRSWGYNSLGIEAGVDFAHMLYSDQVGESVEPRRGRAGVSWIRLLTDLPTCVVECVGGHQDWRICLRSVLTANVEAVFSLSDPWPGVVELALLPYLVMTRGF